MTEAIGPDALSGAKPSPTTRPVRIWDRVTRIVHWFLPVLVFVSWWTARADHLDWHQWCGYALLALLAFRLVWGGVGGSTARFSQFIVGPRAVWRYLTSGLFDRRHRSPGHNPMGGWSVAALLVTLAVIILFGLFAVDTDGVESGPFSKFVSFDQGRLAAHIHHLAFDALLALIGVHLLAILFYALFKGENLIGAMITGRKRLDPSQTPLKPARPWALILALTLAGAALAAVLLA